METKLERISELSKENPEMVFTSIGHLINEDLLKSCHKDMDGKKAVGIDGVTKNMYEEKLVQEALRRIIEAVFEPHFYDEMMGFRPNRGCHDAIKRLNIMLEMRKTDWVLDADIKGFFDHLSHERIVKFVESRIKDPNIIRLVRRMLNAGIMKDFNFEVTEEGSGQGSVCSPILANIYMHYVLVWWFKEVKQPNMNGYCGLVVYADDFVVCFQHKKEAEIFYELLKRRLSYFGLEIEEDKTRLIEFGRFAEKDRKDRGEGKPETFTFLGFTHYCSQSKGGWFRVRRKTSKKKFAKACKSVNQKIRDMRTWKLKQIFEKVNQILVGHYHYYGVTDNGRSLYRFLNKVERILFYWLNRRSNKKSYTWEQYRMMKQYYPLAEPKIYVDVYEDWRKMYKLCKEPYAGKPLVRF